MTFLTVTMLLKYTSITICLESRSISLVPTWRYNKYR